MVHWSRVQIRQMALSTVKSPEFQCSQLDFRPGVYKDSQLSNRANDIETWEHSDANKDQILLIGELLGKSAHLGILTKLHS